MPAELLLHATCLSIEGSGVLLLGAPGAGKSDLALRLIDGPGDAILVSDDQVLVSRCGGELLASPPAAIAGRLEMRGFGIVTVPHAAKVPLKLAVSLVPVASIDRMPDPSLGRCDLLGLRLPVVSIDPNNASAAARVRMSLSQCLLENSQLP